MKRRFRFGTILYIGLLVLLFSWMLGVFAPKEVKVSYSEMLQLFREEKVTSFVVKGNTATLKLNTTVEEAFRSEHIFEVFVSEALLSCIRNGYYVDITDIKNNIKNEKLRDFDIDFAEKHGMK